MEQLNIFDDDAIFNRSYHKHLGFTDWEVDCEENPFCNTPEDNANGGLDDNKKLFCNNNNLTELAVTEYQPRGKASTNNKYYRFSYRDGKKVRHIHIKGGNTSNPVAIKHKDLVKAWIREDVPLEKIIEWIKEL